MQPIKIQFAIRVGYVSTTRISRENNIIQIDLTRFNKIRFNKIAIQGTPQMAVD